jgi:hypothetical protein
MVRKLCAYKSKHGVKREILITYQQLILNMR